MKHEKNWENVKKQTNIVGHKSILFFLFILVIVVFTPTSVFCIDFEPDNVLQGEELDAVNLLIFYSHSSSFNRVVPSSELRSRLSKYDGKCKFKKKCKGTKVIMLNNGAKSIISIESEFDCELMGYLTTKLRVTQGEVGIENGNIFIKEGTTAIINLKIG